MTKREHRKHQNTEYVQVFNKKFCKDKSNEILNINVTEGSDFVEDFKSCIELLLIILLDLKEETKFGFERERVKD